MPSVLSDAKYLDRLTWLGLLGRAQHGQAIEKGRLHLSVAMGPDFICIGMPKAGTGWLFDQLQFHPDFWIPPIKEFNYLNRETPRMENARRLLNLSPKRLQKRLANRRAWDERDQAFLQEAAQLGDKPREVVGYASLFRFKGSLLSGDITPSYITLDKDVIYQVGQTLPDTKVLILIRDPVARAASQISMAYRRERFDPSWINDPGQLRSFLRSSKTTNERCFPSQIVMRWREYAPKAQFRYFFFDDIESRPEHARAEILRFLGADPSKMSGKVTPDHNRKANTKKLSLTNGAKAILVDYFKQEIAICAEYFGGPARNWFDRYSGITHCPIG